VTPSPLLKGVYELPFRGPGGEIILTAIASDGRRLIEMMVDPTLEQAALESAWVLLEDLLRQKDPHAVLREVGPDGTPVVHWRVLEGPEGFVRLTPEPPTGPRRV
jgi:hypothetical protein